MGSCLDRVVSQTRDDFMIVVLKAINSFAIFAATVDSLKVVPSYPPIVFYGIYIFYDLWIEIAVVLMRRRGLVHGLVFEKALAPESRRLTLTVMLQFRWWWWWLLQRLLL